MRWPSRQDLAPAPVIEKAAELLDPSRFALRLWSRKTPRSPFCLTLVYRARNARAVKALVDQVPSNSSVALWALDEVVSDLRRWTVGSGPGLRFALHQQLREQCAPRQDAHWLLCDDDIAPRTVDLPQLVRVAVAAELDVYGPTHARNSYASHAYTCRRSLSLVRETGFVEIGPLVGFSPAAQARLLPLPELEGLGWGMEAYWSSVTQEGLRCALIDAQSLTHTMPPGGSYDAEAEHLRSLDFMSEHGCSDMSDLMVTTATWRPWSPRAPWVPARG